MPLGDENKLKYEHVELIIRWNSYKQNVYVPHVLTSNMSPKLLCVHIWGGWIFFIFLVIQLGSYFGSVICAADVNGDQLDDVIIGAPLYSTNNTEEGRVYVYINKGAVGCFVRES